MSTTPNLRTLLEARDPAFWSALQKRQSNSLPDLMHDSMLRKAALTRGFEPKWVNENSEPVRIAVLGAYTLFPLHELIEHFVACAGIRAEFWVSHSFEWASEILTPSGELSQFQPELTFILTGEEQGNFRGKVSDSSEQVREAALSTVEAILAPCLQLAQQSATQIFLSNFSLPSERDLGPFRSRTLANNWSFKKLVNQELGLTAPSSVTIWDREFVCCTEGLSQCESPRAYFETKQPGSPGLVLAMAREACRLVLSSRAPSKKLLVLDLDNTLWGGIIGEDGIEGIEIGGSPRGEAFQSFQRTIKRLKERGVLLAVCSKNDDATAKLPFQHRPDMVLTLDDFILFSANWRPKAENIKRLTHELNLGLSSAVFIDDSAVEADSVKTLLPEVTVIHLPADPSTYSSLLSNSGLFEVQSLTSEDLSRHEKYESEKKRLALSETMDLKTYLATLEMKSVVSPFTLADLSRITQLINKSNQFNLTTKRRTEAEVKALMSDPAYCGFTIRLSDKFGDYGLISVVIAREEGKRLVIDTWLMSCRVLQRGVEELALKEISRLAKERGCHDIVGKYLPTERNGMVKGLLPSMGFSLLQENESESVFTLPAEAA